MSGITSVVTPIFSAISAADSILAPRQNDLLQRQQLAEQQAQREAQLAADNAARAASLKDSANQEISKRQQTLAKGLSRARAYFAAQGIDPTTGSPEALAAADSADTATQNDFTQRQLDQNLANLNRSLSDLQSNDLLQRTQLKQRQSLNSWL